MVLVVFDTIALLEEFRRGCLRSNVRIVQIGNSHDVAFSRDDESGTIIFPSPHNFSRPEPKSPCSNDPPKQASNFERSDVSFRWGDVACSSLLLLLAPLASVKAVSDECVAKVDTTNDN